MPRLLRPFLLKNPVFLHPLQVEIRMGGPQLLQRPSGRHRYHSTDPVLRRDLSRLQMTTNDNYCRWQLMITIPTKSIQYLRFEYTKSVLYFVLGVPQIVLIGGLRLVVHHYILVVFVHAHVFFWHLSVVTVLQRIEVTATVERTVVVEPRRFYLVCQVHLLLELFFEF